MSRICKKSGFGGFFKSLSESDGGYSCLIMHSTDEQLIMLKTSLKSTAVRAYKRVIDLGDSVACKPTAEKCVYATTSSRE